VFFWQQKRKASKKGADVRGVATKGPQRQATFGQPAPIGSLFLFIQMILFMPFLFRWSRVILSLRFLALPSVCFFSPQRGTLGPFRLRDFVCVCADARAFYAYLSVATVRSLLSRAGPRATFFFSLFACLFFLFRRLLCTACRADRIAPTSAEARGTRPPSWRRQRRTGTGIGPILCRSLFAARALGGRYASLF
jgi:hypothetical protein